MKHKVIKAETMGPWKAAAAAYLAVFIFIPERSGEIGACACTGLGQFIWNLVPVFLCVGLLDVWIERDTSGRATTRTIPGWGYRFCWEC